MDHWDKLLTYLVTPKSGPLPQMSTLLDANRALQNLPKGYLKRPHWLTAGKLLLTAAETGQSSDIKEAFEAIVSALNQEGWLTRSIISAPPLSTSSPNVGTEDGEDIELAPETIAANEEICEADVDIQTPRTDEPLWRRILPNSISFMKRR
jgi:hypothetical protein